MRMSLPGQKAWSTCAGQAGPQRYEVQVGAGVYRRNQWQIRSARAIDQYLKAKDVEPANMMLGCHLILKTIHLQWRMSPRDPDA